MIELTIVLPLIAIFIVVLVTASSFLSKSIKANDKLFLEMRRQMNQNEMGEYNRVIVKDDIWETLSRPIQKTLNRPELKAHFELHSRAGSMSDYGKNSYCNYGIKKRLSRIKLIK